MISSLDTITVRRAGEDERLHRIHVLDMCVTNYSINISLRLTCSSRVDISRIFLDTPPKYNTGHATARDDSFIEFRKVSQSSLKIRVGNGDVSNISNAPRAIRFSDRVKRSHLSDYPSSPGGGPVRVVTQGIKRYNSCTTFSCTYNVESSAVLGVFVYVRVILVGKREFFA